MARPSPQVVAAATAGAGLLVLCGCGSAAAPASSPSATAASPAQLASRFCSDASTFMRNIPAEPATKHVTPAQARANMATVLVATVKGFTGLEKESPAKLRKPLRRIITIYRSDEKILRTTGDMTKVSESMVQGDSSGTLAFQQVLKYISGSCE